MKSRFGSGRWSLLPIAPLIVAVVALAAAALILVTASARMQRVSDRAAEASGKALAATLAARLRAVPAGQRSALVERAVEGLGADVVLFDRRRGEVVVDGAGGRFTPEQVQRLAARGDGPVEAESGDRRRFAVSSLSPPLEELAVLAIVDVPSPPATALRMTNAVAVLTLLMLAMAMTVALVFVRSAREDVTYVRRRIAEMARSGSAQTGVAERAVAVPVRSFDQVGVLTAALNALVARFAEAERGYRRDLEAAARITRERSQFLAGLSHELRTPLNAILGFTHLLASEADGPLAPEAKEAVATIQASGEHLKALVDDILDLSAAETGQLRLTRAIVDVYTVSEHVMREARATVGQRPVELVVEGERALAWADVRRLRQVLTNLVTNALKATAEGEVRIRVRRAAGMASIIVSDTGRGIPREVLETIFAAYQQAGDEAARRGGAGLGLAIARQLVLLHGGTITAASDIGRGSVFTILLPDERAAEIMPRDSLVSWSEGPPRAEASRDVLPSMPSESSYGPREESG